MAYSLWIYFAAKVGSLPIVQLLVDKGAKIERKTWERNHENEHRYPMQMAVEGGYVEIVRYLLKSGANPDVMYPFNGLRKMTYLAQAALNGQQEIVELLVTHGASIKLAIHTNYALHRGLIDYLATVKEKGPNPFVKQEEHDRYLLDCRRYFQAVQLLLDFAQGIDFEEGLRVPFSGLCFLENFKGS